MPFLKNIGLTSKKGGVLSALSVTLSSIASGSSGYFTSSNGVLYTGASVNTPSNVTYQITASGGTQPYTIQWSSSIAYPGGYATADNQSSFTLPTYAGEQDQWSVKVIDSGTPTLTVSASIDTIVFGDDPPSLNVSTVGSDTPSFQSLEIYGSTAAPLGTIGAAIKYAIPSETTIYVASGTYAENPLYSKYVIISGSSSPGLGSGNYFIYDTNWTRTTGSGTGSALASRPVNGFAESSFNRIEVTTSGSIQNAIFDISNSGIITLQSGIYESTSSIRINVNKLFTINGVHVPTGSGTTPYDYIPTSIIRNNASARDNEGAGWYRPIFRAFTFGGNGGNMILSNVGLQIPYFSGSFVRLQTGTDMNVWMEMVKFYNISASVAYELLTNSPNLSYLHVANTRRENTVFTSGVIPVINSLNIFGPRNLDLGSTTQIPTYIHHTGNTTPSAGSGRVLLGYYAPWKNSIDYPSTTDRSQTVTAFYDSTQAPVASGSRPSSNQWPHSTRSSLRLQNVGLSATRPILGFSDSNFNGLPYLNFDGVDELLNKGITFHQTTGNLVGMTIFSPKSLDYQRGVIYKWGNQDRGYSVVITGSNVAISLYNAYTDGGGSPFTASVTMFAPVSVNTPYLTEMFFDSSSIDKRVGMAVYSTSSLITSSYFSSTEFSSSALNEPAVVSATNENVGGAGSSFYRVGSYTKTTTTSEDFFNGRIALIIFDGNLDVHTTKERKSLYDWARYKFFPSSSFVSHSLFSNT